MIGDADREIRLRVFAWLTHQRDDVGEAISRTALENFTLDGRRIPLVGPSGIWKPAVCELPLSITTTVGGPYDDAFDRASGTLRYAYRGNDPEHRDNRGLQRAMVERVPLAYFHALVPGSYVAAYPVFVVEDDPELLRFSMQVDDLYAVQNDALGPLLVAEDDSEPRRAYVTATFRRRLHQVAFRERVIRAYAESCALCRLRHLELLDAAHITADSDAEGEPVVNNGSRCASSITPPSTASSLRSGPTTSSRFGRLFLRKPTARCWSSVCNRSMANTSNCPVAGSTSRTGRDLSAAMSTSERLRVRRPDRIG